jgi:hypothetical protein
MVTESKYTLATKMVAKMVAEELADRNGLTRNEAISQLTKTTIYDKLLDVSTKLWLDNPIDITNMVMYELRGEKIPLELYFK